MGKSLGLSRRTEMRRKEAFQLAWVKLSTVAQQAFIRSFDVESEWPYVQEVMHVIRWLGLSKLLRFLCMFTFTAIFQTFKHTVQPQ